MTGRRGEDAVSSVVGTVLMLGITVAVFAGFSVVALAYLQDQADPPRSDLALVQGDSSLYLVHRGGESFTRDGGVLYINRGGVEESISMTDPAFDAFGVGDTWDMGDQVCIQGTAADCLFPASEDIFGAFLVDEGSLLLGAGERADPNAFRDLTVGLTGMTPANAGQGDLVTWTVRLSNGGTASVPSGAIVQVQVDGVQVSTATLSSSLAPGASALATTATPWDSIAGTHALRLIADPANLIAEGDESNNEAVTSISIAAGQADPGQPFIDLNGDGLYTEGVDTEMTQAQVTQVQGGSFDAGSGSLVLPDSVGDIAADTINFQAGGDIVVAVELSATTNPLTINAGGDIVFDSAELQTLNNNNDMTLTAGGSITGTGLVMSVDGALTITAGGAVDLSGATLVVDFGSRDMSITGTSIDLDGASLQSIDQITITATAGAISANGVQATGISGAQSGAQLWKATGGGITLDGATLSGSSLTACLASGTTDGLSLAGTLSITDGNNRLNAQRGASCSTDANADAYVTPWPASATDSPRSKLE